jgi:hypothetical protein
MRKGARSFGATAGAVTLLLLFSACRGGSEGPVSADAKLMRLTNDYSYIVVSSAKVPGYWAREVGVGEVFFLYMTDSSYKKGDLLRVDGAFGSATAAVFDDETRVYRSGVINTNIFVVWKSVRSETSKRDPAPSQRDRGQ